MKEILTLVALVVTWFHPGVVNSEPDYYQVSPPRTLLRNYAHGLSPPPSRYFGGGGGFHRHHHHDERQPQKLVEGFVSDYAEYGSGPVESSQPSQPPQSPPRQQYGSPTHPNSIPPLADNGKIGYEVVRAPVIYHKTVTDRDTDVTNALADAFGVVQTLRKPGDRQQDGYGRQPLRTYTNVEIVNHGPTSLSPPPLPPPQSQRENRPRPTITTTTTIVDAPKQVEEVVRQNSPVSTSSPVVIAENLPPLPSPSASSLPVQQSAPVRTTVVPANQDSGLPPAIRTTKVIAAPQAAQPSVVSIGQQPQAIPKLIIPSRPHVTTLSEAVQTSDPQIQTIIQPVYIPYAVDQNGQPLGPLPDYHTMDFTAILSAQKQLVSASPHPTPVVSSVPSVQLLGTQTIVQAQQPGEQEQPQQQQFFIQQEQQPQQQQIFIQQEQQPQQQQVFIQQEQQPQQQQFFIQQEQPVAAASGASGNSEETVPAPSPKSRKFGRRIRVPKRKSRKSARRVVQEPK